MCGDDDDLNQIDEEMFSRFLQTADMFGVTAENQSNNASVDLTNEKSRTAYMDGLLKAGLTRAVNDAKNFHHGEHMDVIAGQAIVFARLSGLLAGQFPPESDLFHAVISALMEGHKEAARNR